MLSRTADNLYWVSRYIERAESLARILDAAQRLASLPADYGGGTNEWESALATAGCKDAFREQYDAITAENVIDFLGFSPTSSYSIRRCIDLARSNARAVRTALTVEMWDVINHAWLEMRNFDTRRLVGEELNRFLHWVNEVSLRFDGSVYRTMLRNDGFWFLRTGSFIERADNTARILDVKYHVLLPHHEKVGGGLDYYQWLAVLRAVSALNSYHWVYRESIKPWLVADLLILNHQLPRSLASCYTAITRNLDELAQAYGRQGEAQRQARAMRARFQNARIEEIFQNGLHEFITAFIADNVKLGAAISEQYLSGH
jgi:uncharacterized alpha-E superfamily protein